MLQPRLSRLLFYGITICMFFMFYASMPSSTQVQCDCSTCPSMEMSHSKKDNLVSITFNDQHNLAVLVPYRERFEEMLQFVPYLHNYLNLKKKRHHIFILNQVDNLRFNRAALLNAGFRETSNNFDHVALHDVDLLPVNNELEYVFPSEGPYHVAAPYLHPRYHYPSFIGGILLITRDDFTKVNGMSNNYWGWGLEDDEFYARLSEANLKIFRPANFSSGTQNTFKHIHDRKVRKRDMIKCYNQQAITRKRDRQTGLSTVDYNVQSSSEISIGDAPATIMNIALKCDKDLTPWCDCTSNIGNTPVSNKDANDVIVPKIDRRKHLTHTG